MTTRRERYEALTRAQYLALRNDPSINVERVDTRSKTAVILHGPALPDHVDDDMLYDCTVMRRAE